MGQAAGGVAGRGTCDLGGSRFAGTRDAVPEHFPANVHDGLRTRMARRLMQSRRRLRQRVHEGRTVDGHGDLRLEHVVRYRGRVGVYELLRVNEPIREMVMDRANAAKISRQGLQDGVLSRLQDDGLAKARRGLTTVSEVMRVTTV